MVLSSSIKVPLLFHPIAIPSFFFFFIAREEEKLLESAVNFFDEEEVNE
jgi:hypothetical protein